MSKSDDEKRAFEEFKAWEAARKERERKTHAIGSFISAQKEQMDNSAPITLPREYIWVGTIVVIVLILSAFPSLILGGIIGAGIMAKLSNKWKGS